MTAVTEVAVAILQKHTGEFLLASRPEDKPWAGWWEFPGGKIEVNETAKQALTRELQEELGVMPTQIQAWKVCRFDYPATHDSPAKTVELKFFFVTQWQGELQPKEGQQLSWQSADNLTVQPVLPANAPIIKALTLPPVYAISNLYELGEKTFFNALEHQLVQGLKLIQLREKQLSKVDLFRIAEQAITMAKPFNTKVLINDDVELAKLVGADGVHFTSHSLMKMTQKPDDLIVAASCHHRDELMHAESLGLDFIVVSPVRTTQSHPDAQVLGWEAFTELVESTAMPVYALGGMTLADMSTALTCGARGIAMQRAIWKN